MTSPESSPESSRPVLAALACLPLLVSAACSGPVSEQSVATPASASASGSEAASPQPGGSAASSGTTSCQQLAQQMSREEQVGQLFMVGTVDLEPGSDLQQVVTEHHIGSVIYLGNGTRSLAQTAAMSSRMSGWSDAQVGLLVAVDQEGGQIQRLDGPGFADMPSAQNQAGMSDQVLRTNWTSWGKQLRQAGVRYDLAPVADVVPEDMASRNEPVGQLKRGYGSTDEQVGAKVTAVVQGLTEAGVASSLKHYPGLGRVTTNTDFGSATDDVTTLDDTGSFRAGMQAGASSVMLSSTIYSKIDPGVHAMFSSKIITDGLRGKDGWDKVVISDDMGSAAAVADVPAKDRAVRFISAGGDLVINADPGLMDEMVSGVTQKAETDQAFAEALPSHVARVLELKAQVGLVECSR
ncbi:glycoside hydrolase family 3 N-terminal domain-containing protein [Luteococcus peritonei]|uniref:beta-N-acetylhexosaminidase n=1 Tax=Luteococcus peritonei TaxID=88874 RepID=A0ABW4RUX6_9ACTN